MKKALSLIFAVVMILSIIPLNNSSVVADIFATTASAASDSGSCGKNVKYSIASGVLTISGTGDMTDYSDTSASPFYKNYSIKKVVIGNGVTSIGNNAFDTCSSLKEVTITNTVRTIGEYAFCYCSGLESIIIPEGVKEIGMYAFYACTALKSVTLSSVEAIDIYTFGYCTSLKSITIPSSVSSIGSYAFWCCSDLESIKIPDSVTSVGESAFKKCSSLNNVTISKNISQLSVDMFRECTSLTSVKIPEGVVTIADNTFEGCLTLAAAFIPKSVIAINSGAFKNTSLKDIYYGGTEIGWSNVVKSNCFDTKYTVNYLASPSDIKLTAPIVKTSNVASSGKVKLTWNEVTGAAKYRVYRATSANGTYTLMKTTETTSYVNTSAKAGTKYYYKVRAITSGGKAGLYCDPVSVVCDCAKPVISVSNDKTTGKPVIKWTAVDGASSYNVYCAKTAGGSYELLKTIKETSFTNTTAKAGEKLYYKVMAVAKTKEANSALSSYKGRTCDLPAPDISIALSASGKPTITWNAVNNAVSYKVYRATSKDGTYKLMKTCTECKYTNTSFEPDTTYYYKVKAVCENTDGNSAYSSIKNITTNPKPAE